MASPRTRRLKTDYELLTRRFAGWPIIQIAATAGLPPEVYRFTYALTGLYVNPSGEILERDSHRSGSQFVTRLSETGTAVSDAYSGLSSEFR